MCFLVLHLCAWVHLGWNESRLVNILYGHTFSCICCHELKWRRGVQTAIPEDLSEKVNVNYVTREWKKLFFKVGGYWICLSCNSSVQPKLSAKNRWTCPWEDVPEGLLPLNPVSICCWKLKWLKHDFCRSKMLSRLRLFFLLTSKNPMGGRCSMERWMLFL